MLYSATFPAEAGQYAGTHYFTTRYERHQFLLRAGQRGVILHKVRLHRVR